MAAEALSETTLIDSRTVRTVVALATRPARLLEAHRSGAGNLFVSPIKIFVVMTALFLAVLNLSDVVIYQFVNEAVPGRPVVATADPDGVTVHIANASEGDLWMQRRVTPSLDPRVTAAIEAAAREATTATDRANLEYELQADREQAVVSDRISAWLPNALWLLMPLFAVLLAPLFGRKRLFMEHLVFAMWAHATAFALLAVLALLNRFGAGAPAWPVVIPYLAYLILAARSYYGLSLASAAWRGLLHTAFYVALVLLPAMVAVAVSAMNMTAFLAYIAA